MNFSKEIHNNLENKEQTEEQKELSMLQDSINNPEQNILSEKEYQQYLKEPIWKLETPIYQQVMLRRINELRKKEKLPALKFDEKLTEVANNFWEELSTSWREYNPNPHKDKKGRYVKGRIRDAGLLNDYVMEYDKNGLWALYENIITWWYLSVEDILSMVMNSPGHKRALMSNTDIVGFSHTNPVVQVFAKKNPNYKEPPLTDTTSQTNDTIKKSDQ